MLDSPLRAFAAPFRGLRLIALPRFRRYAALPLLLNIVLFSAMGALAFSQAGTWIDQVLPAGGWHDSVRWLAWPVLALAFLLISFFTFTAVGNVIAAPFADRLAERVLADLGSGGGSPAPIAAGVARSLADGLRKLWHLASRALPVLLLFLVPGVNLAAPAVWFLVGSWLLAFEYLEYAAGAQGVGFVEQRRRMRRNPLLALGFGAGVAVLTLTPVLNLAAIPASVAGACLLWHERLRPAP